MSGSVRRFFGASSSSLFTFTLARGLTRTVLSFRGKKRKHNVPGTRAPSTREYYLYTISVHMLWISLYLFSWSDCAHPTTATTTHQDPYRHPLATNRLIERRLYNMRIIFYHHTSGGVRPCVRVRCARVSVRT